MFGGTDICILICKELYCILGCNENPSVFSIISQRRIRILVIFSSFHTDVLLCQQKLVTSHYFFFLVREECSVLYCYSAISC